MAVFLFGIDNSVEYHFHNVYMPMQYTAFFTALKMTMKMTIFRRIFSFAQNID